MRIAFHVPRASHLEPGFSGDKILVPSLFAGLQERGHDVQIVSRINVRNFWRGRVPARRLVAEANSVRRAMKRFSPDAWFVFGPSVKNPDLFGWWEHPGRYVLFSADAGSGKGLPRGWRWLYATAHRRSLVRADKVAASRPSTADHLSALGVPRERLTVLPPAVKAWDRMPSREEARRRLGVPQQSPVILCVSRFTVRMVDRERPGKTEMVLDLVNSVAQLPSDTVLLLVGDGPGRQQVQEAVARFKLDARIRLAGAIEDVRPFYAACDFFAYPYPPDRPWVALLEAQACGRPVVAMHTSSGEVTVEAGRTGLLAKDLGQFQAHIAALAQDRDRCEAMGRAAREYIASCHSIDVRLRQIEELLRGCT